MLLGDFQRLLHAMHAAIENFARHLFLALNLRFHLHGSRGPGALKLVIQVTRRALAGEGDILTQQIIGIRGGFRRQLHAVVNAFKRITGHKLNVVNQIVQQSGIGAGVTRLALLVVVRLQPEIAAGIP